MPIYPRAPTAPKSITPMDPAVVAARIIEGMETGKITYSFTTAKYTDTYPLPGFSRGDFLGPCLLLADVAGKGQGSDDVATFNKVWDEIHREKDALAGVNPVDSGDEAEYVAALTAKARHLDPQKWADGTVASREVADFAALKTKLTTG